MGAPPAPGIPELTGLRSSKPSWYAEYRNTADNLQRALGSLEHIAGVLSATGRGAAALCRAVVDATAEHLGSPWVVLALAEGELPMARPRLVGRGPAGRPVGELAALPEVVRRPVLEALASRAVEPWQAVGGAVVVPLVVDGEPAGALVACGGPRRTATAADLAILRIVGNQSAVALLSDHLLAGSEELRRRTEQLYAQAQQRAGELAERHTQLAEAELSPQELGFTLEATRLLLPQHDEADPGERLHAAVEEALLTVARAIQQANNEGLLQWLSACTGHVRTEADIAAFLGHMEAVNRQYSLLASLLPSQPSPA